MTKCPYCFRPLPPGGGRGPVTCPQCLRQLPPGCVDAPVTCIAMAGARATGKSIYIAVLIKQIEQLGEELQMTLSPVTESTDRVFREFYERPLYEERGMMAPTQPGHLAGAYQREPLIFLLHGRDGARHVLTIRDVAGEDLEAPAPDAGRLGFFAHADGVLFLFDPLVVPEITEQLQGLVPVPPRLGGEPRTVLGNTLRLVGAATPKLAVLLSKFDAMQALREVEDGAWSRIMRNPGAAFFRDAGPTAAYDDVEGELLHEEVRSLLLKLHGGALVTEVERAGASRRHRFFAVSALGDAPNGESLHAGGIAPFRCLDPLRWVLDGTRAL